MENNLNSLPVGTVLRGKAFEYSIEKVLGQGSFGITYLATVPIEGALGAIEANVAVKEFFMRDINGREGSSVTTGSQHGLCEDYKKKFEREARNLSKLKHPHIVRVMEAFEANGTVYYAMEYIGGGSLDSYIAARGRLSEQECVKFARQICSALQFMHKNGMLHLDLKPLNIMLCKGEAVLIDFGLSKQYNESGEPESSTKVGAGTPGYAPIEQASYQDCKGFPVTMDIYALGATMFKMLTGQRPPEASDILNFGFPADDLRKRGASPWLVALIEQCMAPTVKKRPQSASEVLAVLDAHAPTGEETVITDATPADDEPVVVGTDKPKQQAKSTSATPKPGVNMKELVATSKPNKSRSVSISLVVACLLVIGIVGGIVINRNSTQVSSPIKTINDHEYVDLGLSVKWATCNVGASSPSDYGNYYAWGETTTKLSYTEENSVTCRKKIGNIAGDARYDAARANWGGTWRLPTTEEIDELVSKCQREWTTMGGNHGYKVTGPNGKSIFLPAAGGRGMTLDVADEFGNYLSATPFEDDTYCAHNLFFSSESFFTFAANRYSGQSVRPVSD